jgi:hypothetical protein
MQIFPLLPPGWTTRPIARRDYEMGFDVGGEVEEMDVHHIFAAPNILVP